MKLFTIIGIMALASIVQLQAQVLKIEHIPFDQFQTSFTSLNEKKVLMSMKDAIKFESGNGLGLKNPVDILFEKGAKDEDHKYGLYQWDPTVKSWVKAKKTPFTSSVCGTHDYFIASISSDGYYGIFEENKVNKGTAIVLPKGYRIHSIKFVQTNTQVVYEWNSRLGETTAYIPYENISPISDISIEISDTKHQRLKLEKLKAGKYLTLSNKENESPTLQFAEKTLKNLINDQTLKAKK